MNFLEALICLSLIALLTGLGSFGYQSLVTRTQAQSDRVLIKNALEQARQQGGQVRCDNSTCTLVSKKGAHTIYLSGKNLVQTQIFPAASAGTFQFTSSGLSAYHNGTITVTPPDHPQWSQKIVVSQGGRIK